MTFYTITRGFQEGQKITTAQRSSALFAEEPVVLGKVLRRGSRPLRITGADYRANEAKLLALEKAGSIKIQRPEEVMKSPCAMCGQVPCGQGGEFKCPVCGLPTVADLGVADLLPPQSPEVPEAPTPVPAPPEVIAPPAPAPEPVVEVPAPEMPAAPAPVVVEEKVEVKSSKKSSGKK